MNQRPKCECFTDEVLRRLKDQQVNELGTAIIQAYGGLADQYLICEEAGNHVIGTLLYGLLYMEEYRCRIHLMEVPDQAAVDAVPVPEVMAAALARMDAVVAFAVARRDEVLATYEAGLRGGRLDS